MVEAPNPGEAWSTRLDSFDYPGGEPAWVLGLEDVQVRALTTSPGGVIAGGRTSAGVRGWPSVALDGRAGDLVFGADRHVWVHRAGTWRALPGALHPAGPHPAR